MAEIILDLGSGETLHQGYDIDDWKQNAKKMVDAIAEVDTRKHEIIIKAQLFNQDTIPVLQALSREVFDYLHAYSTGKGYKCTASVFDQESLDYLLNYDIPFVKIAANPQYWWLGNSIPSNIQIYLSVPNLRAKTAYEVDKTLLCIRNYPATNEEYEKTYFLGYEKCKEMVDIAELLFRTAPKIGLSDHTNNLKMLGKYEDIISVYETHFKLEDTKGKDTGPWAKTPEQLKEIL
jgi:sialic acid synthase SpsE